MLVLTDETVHAAPMVAQSGDKWEGLGST
jgi:hypothetical protein